MTEPTKKPKPTGSWMARVDWDRILSRVGGAPLPGSVTTHGQGAGFSVATERYSGTEPPETAITPIARVR